MTDADTGETKPGYSWKETPGVSITGRKEVQQEHMISNQWEKLHQ